MSLVLEGENSYSWKPMRFSLPKQHEQSLRALQGWSWPKTCGANARKAGSCWRQREQMLGRTPSLQMCLSHQAGTQKALGRQELSLGAPELPTRLRPIRSHLQDLGQQPEEVSPVAQQHFVVSAQQSCSCSHSLTSKCSCLKPSLLP